MALTRLAHRLVSEHFSQCGQTLSNKMAVDATCGNGHDTAFLAALGFKRVIGFDIQATAISNTRLRLDKSQLSNVALVHAGHQYMHEHLEGISEIECAMFNFGYLPSADKHLTTLSTSSLTALRTALEYLSATGIICLICYPGHPEGAVETQAIQSWMNDLGPHYRVTEYASSAPKPEAPVLYTICHC